MTSYICNNNQCINLDICDRYNNNSAFFLNLYTLFLTFPFIFVYTYNHSIVKNQLNKYISRFGLLVDENIKLSKESDISEESNDSEESNNSETENEYDNENCEESDDQNCDNEEINEQQSTEEVVTKSGWFY